MSAQNSPSSAMSFGALASDIESAVPPADVAAAKMNRSRRAADVPLSIKKDAPLSISSGSGLLARLWLAYRNYRNVRRLRNLSVELDAHLLEDVGAPSWLVNEVTVNRDLQRLRDVDYLRW